MSNALVMAFSTWVAFAQALVAEAIAPSTCAACDGPIKFRTMFCGTCAASVVKTSEAEPDSDDPSGLMRHYAAFEYGGAMATAIARMKYNRRWDLVARFGTLTGQYAAQVVSGVDVVVSVPAHARRIRERGFDPSALLARAVAQHLRAGYAPNALRRLRDTPPQASLSRVARRTNILDAFECRRPLRLQGARVLLVDDVRTTGSTIAECMRVMREVGAADVRSLVLARAL